MRKRNLPQTKTAKKSRRDRDPIPWRYTLLTLFCALFLVAGFFFAARQHFSSIDYGMKNSKLRKQLDELEGEKRRLILEKEIALSPAEIKKAAKKIGMTTMTASNIEVVGGNPKIAETIKTEKISTFKAAEKTPSEPKPAQTTANKADDKNIKFGKPGKSDKITSEPKKNSDGRDRIAVKTTK
ncbi:MAG: cell division protein FtsL [Acidobacteriota bacterium]|nr:cell division protein FtsL [Acidobacteriota bacterium]